MSNVVSIYPPRQKTFFYEVTDSDGVALWGGGLLDEAFKWLRMPNADRIFISEWETDDLDAVMVGNPIEITSFFKAAVREYGDK